MIWQMVKNGYKKLQLLLNVEELKEFVQEKSLVLQHVLQVVKDTILLRHLKQWLKRNKNMKKYILGLMVAVSLTACGGASSVEVETKDSCSIKCDSVKPIVDTLK